MGLPYLLGDKDPKDPVNGWDKTWAYLKELNQYIDYYPSGTGDVDEEPGRRHARHDRRRTTGWDINPRVLGTVPKEAKVGAVRGLQLGDRRALHGRPEGRRRRTSSRSILDLHEVHARRRSSRPAYDKGYFYPGPAVKDVPLTMAPQESQEAIKEFGRPEYDQLIADNADARPPLHAKALVDAFDIWDREVGGAKVQGGLSRAVSAFERLRLDGVDPPASATGDALARTST